MMAPEKACFNTLAEGVINQTREVIETFGARPPASVGELNEMLHIEEDLNPFAD